MQHDFTLAPNSSVTIDVAGKFFKYKSGNGLIRVRDTRGGFIDLLPGQGVWNAEYTSLTIQDKSGLNNAGVILAGNFDFHDDRISGSVSVIDGGKDRTNTGTACMGYCYIAEQVNMHSHVQLMNPVGSGKNLYVEQVGFFSMGAVTSGIGIRRFDTPLTTLYANGQKKRLGGGLSVAEMRVDSLAGNAGTDPYLGCLDKTLKLFKFTEPVQISPGMGLILINFDLNESLGGTFEFFEEAI